MSSKKCQIFPVEMLALKFWKRIIKYHLFFMGGSIRRTSISLPEDILKAGQQLARKRRRNFSNYVADLIAADAEKTDMETSFSAAGEGSSPGFDGDSR